MLAFMPQPRHLFQIFDESADHFAAEYPPMRGCRARCSAQAGLAPSGSLQLSRDKDSYIITAALPGIRAAEISCIEIIGNRTVHLEVKKSTKKAVKQTASEALPAAADHDDAVVIEPEHGSNEEPVAATTDRVANSTDAESEGKNKVETEDETVVVLDTQLTLPQPVDTSGITCSYQDGLLRIHVPIVAPALGEEHRELIASLEQEAKSAAELVTDLEQKLKEQRAKAREAQMNLHSANVGVERATHLRRHTLTIA